MPIVHFQNADLGYSRREVILRSVNLAVERGAFLGIVGPNGSGKTTLLRTLLGLVRPLAGRVQVGDGRVAIGYVPQRETVDTLFPVPVLDMVVMGRYGRIGPLRRPGRRDRDIALQSLASVGVEHLANRDYARLSGGQRQRVLIARALASEPELLVLDEPTLGMDLPSEHGLLELVQQLHAERRLTVVLVSHLLGSIAQYARRIAIISHGELDEGPREEMLTDERLSRLYGMEVRVHRLEGRFVVLAGSNPA